jgi:anti-anti-sigma factor
METRVEVRTREEGDVSVVSVQGNLDTNTAPDAQSVLDGLMDEGKAKILMDFTELDYISSAGLRVLLATTKRLKSSGGSLRLHSLNETVHEIFEMSGFSTILPVFGGESEALEGF